MSDKKPTSRFKEPAGRPHYVRQWRKYRGYTQEQLAERAEMSPANVSQIENSKQDYTQATLERLASALQCEPADLLMRDPSQTEVPWSLWEQAKTSQREQIISIMKVIVGDTTETDD